MQREMVPDASAIAPVAPIRRNAPVVAQPAPIAAQPSAASVQRNASSASLAGTPPVAAPAPVARPTGGPTAMLSNGVPMANLEARPTAEGNELSVEEEFGCEACQ